MLVRPFFTTMKWTEILFKIRKRLLFRGYTCDGCGVELFDYPIHRFCASCEEKIPKITKPCPKCGRERVSEGVCLTCKNCTPQFTQGVAPFSYKSEGAVVVNRMKNGNQRLAAYLGERMAESLMPLIEEGEELLLVPVPLTEARKRERGYNQSERLAEAVQWRLQAEGIVAELDAELLEKHRETELQKHKSAKERRENAQGAYHVHKRKACRGKTIILIDDILTTGATGSECAKLLLAANAKRVIFLVATALPESK